MSTSTAWLVCNACGAWSKRDSTTAKVCTGCSSTKVRLTTLAAECEKLREARARRREETCA